MPNGFNDDIANWTLDSLFGASKTCPFIPDTVYFAPVQAPFYSNGFLGATEYADQARTAIPANSDTHFPPAVNREKGLAIQVDGGQIVTEWNMAAEYIGIYDAEVGGNLLGVFRLRSAAAGFANSFLYYSVGVVRFTVPIDEA